MELEYRNSYFESGKVVGIASRNIIIASSVLIIFALTNSDPEISFPLIKVQLSYSQAISIGLVLHSFLFYKLISSIKYERLLAEFIQEDNDIDIEETWRISYPNYFNYLQHSWVYSSGAQFKVTVAAGLCMAIFCLIIPILCSAKVLFDDISIFNAFLFVMACVLYSFSIFTATCNKISPTPRKRRGETEI